MVNGGDSLSPAFQVALKGHCREDCHFLFQIVKCRVLTVNSRSAARRHGSCTNTGNEISLYFLFLFRELLLFPLSLYIFYFFKQNSKFWHPPKIGWWGHWIMLRYQSARVAGTFHEDLRTRKLRRRIRGAGNVVIDY